MLVAVFALAGYLFFIKERRFFVKATLALRDYVNSTEDQWAWTTQDGRSFENVEIERIERNVVVFEHNYGRSHLAVAALSDESLQKLLRTSIWRNHDVSGSGQKDELQTFHSGNAQTEKDLKAA
jgi:hypothetical protein